MDSAAVDAYLRREDPAISAESATLASSQDMIEEAENSVLSVYLATRERKLRLSYQAMERLCGRDNVHYLLGIDDSSSGSNIQTSEIALLRQFLGSGDLLYSSLDGLAQTALTKLFLSEHDAQGPRVAVTFLGDDADRIQNFNCEPPSTMVSDAIKYLGGTETSEDPQVHVVILTASKTAYGQNQTTLKLASILNENEVNQLPTIFIDLTQSADGVQNQMLCDMCHLGTLLSYSGRPEMPNCIIMAISQGLARYQALQMPGFLTESAQLSHLSNLASALVSKLAFSDNAYTSTYQALIARNINPMDFGSISNSALKEVNGILKQAVRSAAQPLLDNLCSSNFITSLSPYTLGGISRVSVDNCWYPWLRQMEIDCTLSVDYGPENDVGTYCPAYVQGVSDTQFGPENDLTRDQAVKMVIAAIGDNVDGSGSTSFSDVAAWAQPYAAVAQQKGYVNGYPDGSFRGNDTITRAEFVTILANYLRLNQISLPATTSTSFTDVDHNLSAEELWYAENVYLLANAGIVTGYPDGSFAPQKNVTRAEAVTMLNRLFRPAGLDISSLISIPRFDDCTTPSDWRYPQVQIAGIAHFEKK